MFNNKVTIVKKDATTGNILEEREAKNSQTLASLLNYFNASASNDYLIYTDGSFDAGSPRYFVNLVEGDLENVINEGTYALSSAPGTRYRAAQITGINQPILTFDSVARTVEFEFNGRLNPPSSGTRSFTSIELCVGQINDDAVTGSFGVLLDSPCTQTDSEILDVFYRVQINASQYDDNDYLWASLFPIKFYTDDVYDSGGNNLQTLNSGSSWDPFRLRFTYGLNAPLGRDNHTITRISAPDRELDTSSNPTSYNLSDLTATRDVSLSLSDEVGVVFNSFNAFSYININWGNPNSQCGTNFQQQNYPWLYSHQILPSDVNPLQSQFLHSTTAIRPYLDPSFLGTGQADITFDATSWDEAENVTYRLVFTTAGDVGTAEYKLYKKITLGYPNNEYINEPFSSLKIHHLPSQKCFTSGVFDRSILSKADDYWVNDATNILHYDDANFDNRVFPNIIKLDSRRVIIHDTSGISIVNIYDATATVNIDANSTPAMTTSAINDVMVNETNGEIWVATTDAGLFRISSDLTTVTSMSVAGVTDTECYSVDYKDNGDIWAAFNGGLAQSTNNGTSWTVYNSASDPQFDYTGITDSNWSNIQGIVVDKESANDQLLIVRKGTKATSNIVWWSRAGSSPTSDATDSTVPVNSQNGTTGVNEYGEIFQNGQAFPVRKWVKYFPGSSGAFVILNIYKTVGSTIPYMEFRTINYGATTVRATQSYGYSASTSSNHIKTFCLAFEQDSLGNWGLLHGNQPNSTFSTMTYKLYDPDFTLLEESNSVNDIASPPSFSTLDENYSYGSFNTEYMGKGFMLSSGEVMELHRVIFGPDPFGDDTDPWIQNTIWEEYGWNGSNWVLNNVNSKTVHGTQETLIDGLQVQFADAGTPNFVLNEYIDVNVFKGVHKDNATELDYTIPVSFRPSTVLTDLSTTSVPGSSKGVVTNKTLNFITNTGLSTIGEQNIYQVDGIVGARQDSFALSTSSWATTARDIQHFVFSELVFDGDFSVSFKTTKDGSERFGDSGYSSFGVLPLTDKGSSTGYFDPDYLFEFFEQTYSVHKGNLAPGGSSTLVTDTTISSKDDVYTIERSGTDLIFRVNGTPVHTETGVVTTPFIVQASFYNEDFRTFYDMIIDSYTENARVIELGDPTSGVTSGVYDPNFYSVEAWLSPLTSSFTIDGVDAPVNVDPHTDPVAGSVTLCPKSGWIKLNSADVGLAVTGQYQVLYKLA